MKKTLAPSVGIAILFIVVTGCQDLVFQTPSFDNPVDPENSGNVIPVPFRTVAIGQPGAWDGIEPIITGARRNEIGGPGTDISAVYIAQDNRYVYWRMDVADDSPQIDGYGYKLWGAQPGADHWAQYAIEAHAMPVQDGTETLVTQRRADLEWEGYGYEGDYYAHTGTYVEMRFPLEHVRFNPLAVLGEILWYDGGRSAVTDWRTVSFDMGGHRPTNRISAVGNLLADTPVLIEEEHAEVRLFEDGALRVRATSIAPETSGEIVDFFFQTEAWQKWETYTMPELHHEASAGVTVGSPIIEASEGFYGWGVTGASEIRVGNLGELWVELDFYLELNGGETIEGALAVWFPYP